MKQVPWGATKSDDIVNTDKSDQWNKGRVKGGITGCVAPGTIAWLMIPGPAI